MGTAKKLKKLLDETTDSRTYRIAFSHHIHWDWLEDKRNNNYNTYWRSRPFRNWKEYRHTQWKPKIKKNEDLHCVSPRGETENEPGHDRQDAGRDNLRTREGEVHW